VLYFLSLNCSSELSLNLLGIVCNISATTSENSKFLVEKGIIAPTVALLDSPHLVVVLLAIRTLANLIQDGPELGNRVMEEGAIASLLKLVQPNASVLNQRYITIYFESWH